MAGTSSEMTRRQSRLVISKGERGGGQKYSLAAAFRSYERITKLFL